MILVIAEKPSLGKAIAAAIDGQGKMENGCIYKGKYCVTWVFGHLLGLKEPEDYDPKYAKWTIEDLPIYFKDWQQKISPDKDLKSGQQSKAARVKQIGELLDKCEYVIHAGDPDDEGQFLIDEILAWHGYKGKVMRLQTSDTTLGAMKKALANMTDNKDHVSYGRSAYARSVSDMLFGINMSRFFSVLNHQRLTVGRVQTPTLGLVVARDEQIEGFSKIMHYTLNMDLTADGKTFPAEFKPAKDNPALTDGKYILDKDYLAGLGSKLTGRDITGEIKKQTSKQNPPLPFNLVKLQSYCSSKYNMTPQQTLDATQSLRENHSAITYNRSDCQYLSEEHYKEAPKVVAAACENVGFKPKGLDLSIKSKCFNDANITAHHAIIPTDKKINLSSFTEHEKNVYLAVCKYYLAQFMPPATKEKTTFTMKGKAGDIVGESTTVTDEGYLSIFKEVKRDPATPLSEFPEGKTTASVGNIEVKSHETEPPKRYTQASLNEDMTCIAKYVKDPKAKEMLLAKDKDKKGENGSIGTSATRTYIIQNLISRGYLQEKGKTIISTPLGREFYKMLPDAAKLPDMTGYWWAVQEDIKEGKEEPDKLILSVLDTVKTIIGGSYKALENSSKASAGFEVVGTCPRCGKRVIERKPGFFCEDSECGYKLFKKSNHPSFKNITITAAQAKKLIAGNKVKYTKLYSSKTGKDFTAFVYLEDDPSSKWGPAFKFEFENKGKK